MSAVMVAVAAAGLASGVWAAHAGGTSGSLGNCYNADCWRENGGATDMWQRDVKGDLNQQYFITKIGTVNSTGCFPGFLVDGLGSVAVFSFQSLSTGRYVGAGYGGYIGEDPNGFGGYDQWAVTAAGTEINCGQTWYWGAYDFVCQGVAAGQQDYVNGGCAGGPFTWVDPPARRR